MTFTGVLLRGSAVRQGEDGAFGDEGEGVGVGQLLRAVLVVTEAPGQCESVG